LLPASVRLPPSPVLPGPSIDTINPVIKKKIAQLFVGFTNTIVIIASIFYTDIDKKPSILNNYT
jgi:hypothetical protein